MSGWNPFRRIEVRTAQSCDIESLFKDLRNRSNEFKELYAPQVDVLRDYQKTRIKSKDVRGWFLFFILINKSAQKARGFR
jgi:hypothetical protein